MYIPLVKKWNVLTFDHVIGQPMVVKILKNSLFLDHIFPVYIFSGKHGCGKTSTARLFSTALNCFALPDFRKNVHRLLPCDICDSCRAMRTMQHPDFIEIDAASHTGVDNVRLIIESALLLPIFGNKKIYLIDEAHMLSKAAWNAFLKILEEPPKNVIFILATTAEEKILETVRSRCFKLFFKAMKEEELIHYLLKIATEEKIEYTKEGMHALARASNGSLRDALNLLDQARLSTGLVDIVSLSSIVFHSHEQEIIQLLQAIFSKNIPSLLHNLHNIFASNQVRTEKIIDRLISYAHAILLFLYGQKRAYFAISPTLLQEFLYVNPALVINFLQELYDHEIMIKQVERPEILLEIILLQFIESVSLLDQDFGGQATKVSSCAKATADDTPDPDREKNIESSRVSGAVKGQVLEFNDKISQTPQDKLVDKAPIKPISLQEILPAIPQEKLIENNQSAYSRISADICENTDNNSLLSQFIKELEIKRDPLLLSIFKQALLKNFDKEKKILTFSFKKDLLFFESLLYENKSDWQPLLEKIWGTSVLLQVDFSIDNTVAKVQKEVSSSNQTSSFTKISVDKTTNESVDRTGSEVISTSIKIKTAEPVTSGPSFDQKKNNNFYNTGRFSKLKPIDVSDQKKWPYANTLQEIFPGVITEVE